MSKTLLHRTVIQEADFLGVGIAVETCCEHHAEEDREWWYLFYQCVTWVGLMPEVLLSNPPVYMMGKIKGLNQEIKIELSMEAIEEVSQPFHSVAEHYTSALKPALVAGTFVALAKAMQ